MRIALIVACLAMLGGCNILMTKDPLFTKADETGATPLKPGVWAEAFKPDCQVDVAKPLAEWPSCANGFIVFSDGRVASYESHDGKPVWVETTMVTAAGDPMVAQIHLVDHTEGAPPEAAYAYAGMRPTKLDDQGRAIEVTTWPVLCGPPPPADAKKPNGDARYGTLAPAPGMTMDSDSNDCTTTDPAAARAVAHASEAWTGAESFTHDHWVRDGER